MQLTALVLIKEGRGRTCHVTTQLPSLWLITSAAVCMGSEVRSTLSSTHILCNQNARDLLYAEMPAVAVCLTAMLLSSVAHLVCKTHTSKFTHAAFATTTRNHKVHRSLLVPRLRTFRTPPSQLRVQASRLCYWKGPGLRLQLRSLTLSRLDRKARLHQPIVLELQAMRPRHSWSARKRLNHGKVMSSRMCTPGQETSFTMPPQSKLAVGLNLSRWTPPLI